MTAGFKFKIGRILFTVGITGYCPSIYWYCAILVLYVHFGGTTCPMLTMKKFSEAK